MKILLVTDIQNDFLPGGALAVPHGDEVISLINRLMPTYELVIATQDWHPADHASFAASHRGRKIGELTQLHGLPQILWPTHCVQHTPGAAFASALDTGRFSRVFQKGVDADIDSYSGFFDNGHRRDTGLAACLRANRVTALDIVGLATDYCVKATALDARREGFAATVLLPACRGVELHPGDIQAAIAEMRAAGVAIQDRA